MKSAPWYELHAYYGRQFLWATPALDAAGSGALLTRDARRRFATASRNGELHLLPFTPLFERDPNASTGTKRGDILWSGGLPITLVSRRFAEAIEDLGVTKYDLYDVDFVDFRGGRIEGYVGFAANLEGTSEVVTGTWHRGWRGMFTIASARVVKGLVERGIDGFHVSPVEEPDAYPRLTKS